MLVLYGTEHCHLCEQAESLLHALDIPFRQIDIAEVEELLERYGTLIPVLCDAHQRELRWPFQADDVRRFLHPG